MQRRVTVEMNEYIEKNPTRWMRNVKVAKTLPVFLTKDEADRLIRYSRINSRLPYRLNN